MPQSSTKVAIGFVAYNPCRNLIDRIKLALSRDYVVYIYDNSPDDGLLRESIKFLPHVHYSTSGKNLGLGVGISTVCAQAYVDGFNALIFFDQDTVFNEETLAFIKEFFKNNCSSLSMYSAVSFNAEKTNTAGNCFQDVMLIINSGTLLLLENVKRLNWFSEFFFVDGVDYEFCLRSKMHGLKICKYSCTPGFDHESEQGNQQYTLFNKELYLRKYSFSRISDVFRAYTKIICSAIKAAELPFAFKICRLLLIYLLSQLLVRITK